MNFVLFSAVSQGLTEQALRKYIFLINAGDTHEWSKPGGESRRINRQLHSDGISLVREMSPGGYGNVDKVYLASLRNQRSLPGGGGL